MTIVEDELRTAVLIDPSRHERQGIDHGPQTFALAASK